MGRHPCLDVLIETSNALIGIEAKRFEPFRRRLRAAMSERIPTKPGETCSYHPETGRFEDAWIWKDLLGEDFTRERGEKWRSRCPTKLKNSISLSDVC